MPQPIPHLSLADVFAILENGPGRFASAARGVSDEALHEPLEPGGWSARDVLAHVRACDRTWGGYAIRILDQDQPSIRYESPRGTIRRFGYLDVPFAASLKGFRTDRARLLDRLRTVTHQDLDRIAAVKVSGGRVETWSAFGYAHRIADHELEHVEHLERELAPKR